MAFCNACGATLDAGAKFCPKCGATSGAAAAPVAVSPVATSPLPPPPPPAKNSGALKIILIILAVFVGLIILAGGSCAYFLHRIATHSHINQKNGEVNIDTPFGSINSSNDPAETARQTGVDAYPGAAIQKNGSVNMTIGKMHTATATYDTDDSPSSVADFYKSKFPNASVTSGEDGRYSFISGTKEDLTTINIETREGKTRIVISRVTNADTMSH